MSLAPQGRMSDTVCSGLSLCLPSAALICPGKVLDVLGDNLGSRDSLERDFILTDEETKLRGSDAGPALHVTSVLSCGRIRQIPDCAWIHQPSVLTDVGRVRYPLYLGTWEIADLSRTLFWPQSYFKTESCYIG